MKVSDVFVLSPEERSTVISALAVYQGNMESYDKAGCASDAMRAMIKEAETLRGRLISIDERTQEARDSIKDYRQLVR